MQLGVSEVSKKWVNTATILKFLNCAPSSEQAA